MPGLKRAVSPANHANWRDWEPGQKAALKKRERQLLKKWQGDPPPLGKEHKSFVNAYYAFGAEALKKLGVVSSKVTEECVAKMPADCVKRFTNPSFVRCSWSWMTDKTTLNFVARHAKAEFDEDLLARVLTGVFVLNSPALWNTYGPRGTSESGGQTQLAMSRCWCVLRAQLGACSVVA